MKRIQKHRGFKRYYRNLAIVNDLEDIPFSLNLIGPILTDFDYLLLDYNKPNNPKKLYPINTAEITSAYEEINHKTIG